VLSDWGATHDTSIAQGLDQDQHMQDDDDPFFQPQEASEGHINGAVVRILAAMYHMDTFSRTKCIPPNCEPFFTAKATSNEHVALSREFTTESIVLLKNDNDVMPLKKGVKTIAVVGSMAIAEAYNGNDPGKQWNIGDYYSGGGSGHMVSGYIVKPLDGIKKRAKKAGIVVLSSPSDDIAAAIAVAEKADVTIILGGTTCGEAIDRHTLAFDNDMDSFIPAVAKRSKRTVVLAQVPGPVTMPWRKEVDSLAMLFLGGPETGNAWADVLFGDHAPSGRLPIMLPETEKDTIEPTQTANTAVPYSEKFKTSYRNKDFKAAYQFGHGLTYTNFAFSHVSTTDCGRDVCIKVKVLNQGKVAAKAVAQLYLEFPEEAEWPTPVLKGFEKTGNVKAGASSHVTFRLSDKELNYFMPGPRWVRVSSATAHVGGAADDIHFKTTFTTKVNAVAV